MDTNCGNEFIFQSGIHRFNFKLHLRAGSHLILTGQEQEDTIIECQVYASFWFKANLNITINNIKFFKCKKFQGFGTSVYFSNMYLIKSYLTLDRSAHALQLQGSPNDSIVCSDASFINIYVAPRSAVKIFNMWFHNCSQINLISRSKSIAIQILKSWFTNSCLQFKSNLTNSASHTIRITVEKTTFEQCFCRSMQLFTKPSIKVNITLKDVTMVDNNMPFLESENRVVSIRVMGHCTFDRNRNFIMYLDNVRISFIKAEVNFTNGTVNATAVQGAPIYAKNSKITFDESTVMFKHNQGPLCGGIVAESTQIYFKDNVTITFRNNSGLNGGALSLYTESRLHFNSTDSNITLYFQNNTAQIGGAIYVEDSGYKDIESIFKLECEPENVKLVFDEDNVASFSGNQIYGGWIDWFVNKTNNMIPESHTDIVNRFIKFSDESYTQVSSHPIRICLCINNIVDCNITNYSMTIYGRALSLDLVGVGQRYTPVISLVQAHLVLKGKSKIHQSNFRDTRLLSLQSACTKVDYRINSQRDEENISLKPYLPYLYYSSHAHDIITNGVGDGLFQQLTVKLKLNECPWGFTEQTNGSCECQLSNHV